MTRVAPQSNKIKWFTYLHDQPVLVSSNEEHAKVSLALKFLENAFSHSYPIMNKNNMRMDRIILIFLL